MTDPWQYVTAQLNKVFTWRAIGCTVYNPATRAAMPSKMNTLAEAQDSAMAGWIAGRLNLLSHFENAGSELTTKEVEALITAVYRDRFFDRQRTTLLVRQAFALGRVADNRARQARAGTLVNKGQPPEAPVPPGRSFGAYLDKLITTFRGR